MDSKKKLASFLIELGIYPSSKVYNYLYDIIILNKKTKKSIDFLCDYTAVKYKKTRQGISSSIRQYLAKAYKKTKFEPLYRALNIEVSDDYTPPLKRFVSLISLLDLYEFEGL